MKVISDVIRATNQEGAEHSVCITSSGQVGICVEEKWYAGNVLFRNNGTTEDIITEQGKFSLTSITGDLVRSIAKDRKQAEALLAADVKKTVDAEIRKLVEANTMLTILKYRLDAVMISGSDLPESVKTRLASCIYLVDSNRKSIPWQPTHDDDYPQAIVNLAEIIPIAYEIENELLMEDEKARQEGYRDAWDKFEQEETNFWQNHNL